VVARRRGRARWIGRVSTGWTSARAWLVAGAGIAVLVLVTWLIARSSHRRGRGAELALRRYDLRRPVRRGPAAPGGGIAEAGIRKVADQVSRGEWF
jgi:hypothetical protein